MYIRGLSMTYEQIALAALTEVVDGQPVSAAELGILVVETGRLPKASVKNFLAKVRQFTAPGRTGGSICAHRELKTGLVGYAISGEVRDHALATESRSQPAKSIPIHYDIYVDGSFSQNRAGAGIWIPALGLAYAFTSPALDPTSAERFAIAGAVYMAAELDLERYTIHSDAIVVCDEIEHSFKQQTLHPNWNDSFFESAIVKMQESQVSLSWQPREYMLIADALAKFGRGRNASAYVSYGADPQAYKDSIERLKSFSGGVADRVYASTGLTEGNFYQHRGLDSLQSLLSNLAQQDVIVENTSSPFPATENRNRFYYINHDVAFVTSSKSKWSGRVVELSLRVAS